MRQPVVAQAAANQAQLWRALSVAAAGGVVASHTADVLVRRRAGEGVSPMEVRVAIIGNVDSGKSTLVGVLTRSMLDDGRGLARGKVRR